MKLLPWISVSIFILSITAVHGAWFSSLHAATIPICFPYVEGCVTISRAARSSNGLYFFKTLMYMVVPLLILYWQFSYQYLTKQGKTPYKGVSAMRILGIIGALFLILYIYNLGLDGDFYRWMRRYGVTIYFSFTALAQLLFVQRLFSLRDAYSQKPFKQLALSKCLCCTTQWCLGLISIPLGLILKDDAKNVMNNIVEWNFAFSMNLFFLCSFLLFRWLNTGKLVSQRE